MDLAKDLYVYSYLNELKEGDTVILKVRRDGETKEIQYTPDVSVRYLLGFNRSDASSMTVESLIAGMPLEMAGLQPGDTITAINGTEIADGEAYDAYLKEHPLSDEPVEITYVRDGLDYTGDDHTTGIPYTTVGLFLQSWLRENQWTGRAEIWCSGSEVYDSYDTSESEAAGYRKPWI